MLRLFIFPLLFVVPVTVIDRPLPPAWSPDHQVLATTTLNQAFVTPEGGNYKLLLNGKVAYPTKFKHSWFSGYEDQHTFLSGLSWSPDSRQLAFVEKIYDWEYTDPYNRYFYGRASKVRFYLAVATREGIVRGYPLPNLPQEFQLQWGGPNCLSLDGQKFDLRKITPQPIP